MAKTLENTATSNGSGDPPQPATDDDPSGAATRDADNDKKQLLLRIAVGTTNPCKIAAVKKAVEKAMDTSAAAAANNGADRKVVELHIEGFAVESGVPGQPFGDEETLKGAKTRARNAYLAYRAAHGSFPHMSFGLEGGLEWSSAILDEDDEDSLWCMAWMAVYGKRKHLVVDLMASAHSKYYTADKEPIFGLAKTATFMLPSALTALIRSGMELGDADDKVFGRVKAKHGSGTVGLLTDGMIDRSAYYEHALTLAMVSWIRPDVYTGKGGGSSSLLGSIICGS